MAFSDYPYQMSMAAMADYKNEVRALSAKYRENLKTELWYAQTLAFTMAYDASYVPAMIVGKLISGAFALALAFLIYKREEKKI